VIAPKQDIPAYPSDSKQWPHILGAEYSDNAVLLKMHVPKQTTWFDGHFPGQPVLPGVAQIFWVEFFACHFFSIENDALTIRDLKFNNVIIPDTPVALRLTSTERPGAIKFSYSNADTKLSSGLLVYASAKDSGE